MRNLLMVMGLLLLETLYVQCESASFVNKTRLQAKELISKEPLASWSLEQLQKHVEDLEKHVKQNPGIPEDFIYVQLPFQPEPSIVWSTLRWQDISYQYAGLFFRTIGDGADGFGKVQLESAPSSRILRYHTSHESGVQGRDRCYDRTCDLAPNGWSDLIYTGNAGNRAGADVYLTLESETKSGEVRPKNTAIKIWKRL